MSFHILYVNDAVVYITRFNINNFGVFLDSYLYKQNFQYSIQGLYFWV